MSTYSNFQIKACIRLLDQYEKIKPKTFDTKSNVQCDELMSRDASLAKCFKNIKQSIVSKTIPSFGYSPISTNFSRLNLRCCNCLHGINYSDKDIIRKAIYNYLHIWHGLAVDFQNNGFKEEASIVRKHKILQLKTTKKRRRI